MDTKNLIEYLNMVSNNNIYLNLGMHLIVIASLVSIFLLKRSKLLLYVLEGTILILFMSVTINAVIFGNPFHAVTFGIMSITAGYFFTKIKKETGKTWELHMNVRSVIAFIIIALGLWYPELTNVNIFQSALLSPVGVIPCPTLITTLGLMNLFIAFVNNKQLFITIFFGILYGFIGTFKLDVHFDIILICAVLFSLYNIISQMKKMKLICEVKDA